MFTARGNSPAASSWAASELPERIEGWLAAIPFQNASALSLPHSDLVAVNSKTAPCSTAMRPFQAGLVRSAHTLGYSSGLTRFVFSDGANGLTRSVTHMPLGSLRLSGYRTATAGNYCCRDPFVTSRQKKCHCAR